MGDIPVLFYIPLALLLGLIVGLVNGSLIGRRRVSAVIATLAVATILVGIVQFLQVGNRPAQCLTFTTNSTTQRFGFSRHQLRFGSY
jgi:ribose/xylose/arabinose/galactoside ABC-type transport system permease subunit